ncbi:MAG: NUDIX hydrolase [Myxococcota bacterium]|nr:NUDIX hydrolase [Myxococcota bacterium]
MIDRSGLKLHLESHRPFDDREAGYCERMLDLLAVPSDPFSRDHFAPGHFTASSFVLTPDRTRVLLILHARLGLWLQPGGHFDPEDDDALAAARREVVEETGIRDRDLKLYAEGSPLLDVDIHSIPANPARQEPGHEHFDLRFLLVASSEALCAGSDALEARWVALGEVQDAGTDDSVRRAIRKLGCLL